MRRSPLLHVTLGMLVVLMAAVAGKVSRIENHERHRPQCSKPPACASHNGGQMVTWRTPTGTAPARLIVQFKKGVDPIKFLKEIAGAPLDSNAQTGIFDETFSALPGLAVMRFGSSTDARGALDRYRRDPRVEFAELDAYWHVDGVEAPNDARYGEQWGLENTGQSFNGGRGGVPGVDIGAREAWVFQQGSEDVVVAVIDSGVDYNHQDLAANMWVNENEIPGNGIDDDNNGVIDDVHGFNAIENSGDPDDDLGHGTHVAGIIGAVGDNGEGVAGVNWRTRIMALKFLDPIGGGSTTDAIECINYIIKMKERGVNIRVVNCSWGGTEPSRALEEAIKRAADSGVLFVCASGNDGLDTDSVPHFPSSYDTDGVIAVAALAPNDALAGFSNWGRTSVDIAAPGVDILSTLPEGRYGYASGTSMASPFVAGVAALVAAEDPSTPVKSLRSRVLDGSFSVSDFASRLATGGRLSGPGSFAK